ncbi:Canalicular multispecific organic anion transporter 1, partial [Coemansia biformis]
MGLIAASVMDMCLAQVATGLALVVYAGSKGTVPYTQVMLFITCVRSLVVFANVPAKVLERLKSFDAVDNMFKGIRNTSMQNFIGSEATSGDKQGAVDLDKCMFSWGEGKFALQPVSVAIAQGSFVGVIGKVGSGKSSFLSALCGDMPLVEGSGVICGRVAYVSQNPWIMNATFRDNVLFGNDYDEQRYLQTLEACALSEDVKQFPSGDMCEIGHRGINLSGGQKARLALARAIYENADVYILDDVLSAVDANVERHLVERVLSTGGLLGAKTRVLITHAEHVVPLCDMVITMSDGCFAIRRQVPKKYTPMIDDASGAAEEVVASNDDNAAESGTFKIDPGLSIPPFSRSMLWKFLAMSGYATVALCIAIQIAKTHAIHHLEEARRSIVSANSTHMDGAALWRFLLVNLVLTISRTRLLGKLDD